MRKWYSPCYTGAAPDTCAKTHLINESEVMGHKHKAALEALDGLSQGVNGFNVQMVGGLIQQQQVGVLHADHGKHKATLLTITQLPYLGRLHLACTPTVCSVSRLRSLAV